MPRMRTSTSRSCRSQIATRTRERVAIDDALDFGGVRPGKGSAAAEVRRRS